MINYNVLVREFQDRIAPKGFKVDPIVADGTLVVTFLSTGTYCPRIELNLSPDSFFLTGSIILTRRARERECERLWHQVAGRLAGDYEFQWLDDFVVIEQYMGDRSDIELCCDPSTVGVSLLPGFVSTLIDLMRKLDSAMGDMSTHKHYSY